MIRIFFCNRSPHNGQVTSSLRIPALALLRTLSSALPGGFAARADDAGADVHAQQAALVELLGGEIFGMSYSGYREGQHPDRGDGAIDPSREEILEDLDILLDYDFRLIRMYDSGAYTQHVLALIREHDLPFRVLLGVWLRAEVSNHEGCPWLDEPIPEAELAANVGKNAAEVEEAIRLAREYDDIVVAVNVGNEALVDWNDHMVTEDSVIAYVRRVKEAIEQPVTVADNFLWWAEHGARLAAELDFIGVHSYPMLDGGGKPIDQALAFTIENVEQVRAAIPDRPIAILEAGWATTSGYLPQQASEENQQRYFHELRQWAHEASMPVFFFEAFDEPWKGNADDHLETSTFYLITCTKVKDEHR